MYTRQFKPPNRSYILLGPRGTGKTTWVRFFYDKKAFMYDLLRPSEFLRLQSHPETFENEVLALPSNSTILIDEIQKLPILLDIIHDLLVTKKGGHQFVMTGSSARKLKRSGANLLAGRASFRTFFPLIFKEFLQVSTSDDILRYGTLPEVFDFQSSEEKIEFLEAYALTYLREEIQQEAVIKNVDSFSRFLKVAAVCNGQTTNVSSLARDSGVSRSTVQGYFQAIEDTLIGNWLPAWEPKVRIKERHHPKFYFFDCGVARVLSGKIREPLSSEDRGFLLETFLFHELRAWKEYQNNQAHFSFWQTKDSEVDFIIELGNRRIGIEVKSTPTWKTEYGKTLEVLMDEKQLHSAYGVYLGSKPMVVGQINVLPLENFLQELWSL